MADDRAPVLHDAHQMSPPQVARHLGVDVRRGLAAAEVTARQTRHGPNRLPEAPLLPWWRRALAPLRDFMTLVLLAAAVVSGLVGDVADTVVILVIVALNAGISVWQEWRADRALAALATLAESRAVVRRDGAVQPVPSAHLVPGDVVLLEAGQRVPADLRLHDVAQLHVDESMLTGESATVAKQTRALDDGDPAVHDRSNMAWKGTLVTQGRAEGLVVATGTQTQLGRIADLMDDAGPSRATPLQLRLAAFGRRLSLVVLAICGLVFGLGLMRGEPAWQMALTAISLAVAAIPEALPAVVAVLLALGARRMVQVHALVRRLPAVETLGSVTVICTDKTGTLTQNRMVVSEALHWGASAHDLWTGAVLCNDARPGPHGWQGDPTETALLAHAESLGIAVEALRAQAPRLHEWPFDPARKRMSTRHAGRLVTKGAPESVIPCCTAFAAGGPHEPEAPWSAEAALDAAHRMARQGLRVLAVAERVPPAAGAAPAGAADAGAVEQDLRLLGLIGLVDPPRPEAAAAVADGLAAGIRPVMITGDHPQTARAIAAQLGIAGPAAPVLTGGELSRMDDARLEAEVARTSVYARMDPAQKIRIVEALQRHGHFVAMTGDGVNDAPALQRADIGVAMGLGGTDAAREASSLVLLDDHFATIVAAVREGRRIYDNVRKFVRYAMTGNSGEIWVLLLAPLLGLPMPLAPIHILWINLVTDGLPGLALAAEPAEPGVMQRPPRPPDESVFAHGLWQHALWVGLLIGALCLGIQAWALARGNAHGQTMVFTVLTCAQMAHVLAIRSERLSLFSRELPGNTPLALAVGLTLLLQLAVVYVPWLQPWFQTQPLTGAELALCLAASAVVFVAVEIEKAWHRRRQPAG